MRRWFADDSAATATEYAVIMALIIAGLLGPIVLLGNQINSTIVAIMGKL